MAENSNKIKLLKLYELLKGYRRRSATIENRALQTAHRTRRSRQYQNDR
ncbi:MAG: hypothetical protein IKZ47_00815 [Clostridia bacterium]|nr:hypothetical protein [Clostridia bacterium]